MSRREKNKALYDAVTSGDVRRLLDDGTRVDQGVDDFCMSTPLHVVTARGHVSVMELLLEKGGGINAIDVVDDTPLHEAASNGEKEAVSWLIERGCKVDTRNNSDETPLHKAAWSGWTEVMNCIIERGGYIKITDKDGYTPLHVAVLNNKLYTAEVLLQHGAHVQAVDNDKKTPFYLAVLELNAATMKLLLQYGAMITFHPAITLHDAIRSDCIQLVGLLVEAGADVNAKAGRLKDTLLHQAVRHGSLDMVKELIGRGSDMNAADRKGNTPLNVAAWRGRHGLMKTLVEAWGNFNVLGERGTSRSCVLEERNWCQRPRARISGYIDL